MTGRTAVLGGGALGLTLAYRLARAGEHVVVYEGEELPGGLAAGFRPGADSVWLEKFYHHLFATDRDAVDLIRELGLSDQLDWIHANTSHFIQGRPQRLDGVVPALRFRPVPPLDRVRLLAGIGFLKLWPRPDTLEGRTAAEWMRRWMGTRAYDAAFEPLFRGKFGTHADQVALPWIWARLHYRTPKLGYLRGGFQQLYDRLADAACSRGAELRLATRVTGIRAQGDGSLSVATAEGGEDYDRVVSTLAPRLTYHLAPDIDPAFRASYDWPLAYGAHCLILALDRPLMRDVYWLSIADPGFPFLAVVEHTNMQDPALYSGRHLVYLGNYLPMDHPLMRAPKSQVLDEFLPHLTRINPQFSPDWVTDSWQFAAPYAQPIVTPDFRHHIPPFRTPVANLYMASMFQVYPQDRGQNYSIRLANRLAAELIRSQGGAVSAVPAGKSDSPVGR